MMNTEHVAPRDRPLIPAVAREKWIVGVDLGQSIDYTAICALRHSVKPLDEWESWHGSMRQKRIERFDVLHLERLKLGMPYPSQVARVKALLDREPLKGAALVIDESGVGRPVADIFNAAGMTPTRIAIGSGLEPTRRDGMSWTVPKSLLISGLEAAMHCGTFKIAPKISAALIDELSDFQRKISESGRSTWDARTGKHDDLVLACAISLWWAQNRGASGSSVLRI